MQQGDSSTILAIANKKWNSVANIKLIQSWSDYQETTSYRLRVDVSKYSAVIQATPSTPSGTQLTQYPSSRETIRQRNSRPGVRLPHLIGRCRTKTRAGPLARGCPRWTLREVHTESSTIGDAQKPRIFLDTLVPQIDASERSGGLDNFVESRRQNFRKVRRALEKRHQSKANARRKANNKNNKGIGRDCSSTWGYSFSKRVE